jgi:putative nucleotidyltransferase with HDIG domain
MRLEKLKIHVIELLTHKLNKQYSYHSMEHTLYVYEAAYKIADFEKVNDKDKEILLAAVLLHDIGYIENHINHELASCQIAEAILTDFEFSEIEISKIKSLIMSTKVPQMPKNLMEQIICDADLDYLGTDNFIKYGNELCKELEYQGIIANQIQWNELQVKFLSAHEYHTSYSKKYRNPKKQENLSLIMNILQNTYKYH